MVAKVGQQLDELRVLLTVCAVEEYAFAPLADPAVERRDLVPDLLPPLDRQIHSISVCKVRL